MYFSNSKEIQSPGTQSGESDAGCQLSPRVDHGGTHRLTLSAARPGWSVSVSSWRRIYRSPPGSPGATPSHGTLGVSSHREYIYVRFVTITEAQNKNDSIIFIRSQDMNIRKIEYIYIKLAIICKKFLGGKKILGFLSKNVVILIIWEKEFLSGAFHLFWPIYLKGLYYPGTLKNKPFLGIFVSKTSQWIKMKYWDFIINLLRYSKNF